jgi:hypothetical protein
VTNGFPNDFAPGVIQFTAADIVNPQTTETTSTFVITTYTDSTLAYEIDSSEGTSITLTALPRPLTSVVVTPEAPVITGIESVYTIALKTSNSLP